MKRAATLLAAMALAAALIACLASAALAEPQKNQITVPNAVCDDGSTHTFVINGMGKVGHLPDESGNLEIKRYTLIYKDPDTGEVIGSDQYGGGNKTGLDDNLVTCHGETTTELVGLGLVTVDFELEGFFTSQNGQ